MAKAKLNPLFVEFSGTMGGFVFKKSKSAEAIITRRPRPSDTALSEAHKAQRERFKQAVAYARAAMADPAVCAAYEEIAAREE